MRPKVVLAVENLSKVFYDYDSGLKRVLSWFMEKTPSDAHKVLSNISLNVSPGESVGIVGLNGSGKSTFLKIIAGVTHPTEGRVVTNGSLSSILELGMGFHPDFSGRQNVVNVSKLMGYSLSEISKNIDSIEEFADIGEYFDQPMRVLSSGMQMRVAFAVATAYKPDILIVDEALSVGDFAFQHKCFERIRELKNNNCSLLIVSHDKSTIQGICDRAILLDNGRVKKDASPEEVFDYYNALISGANDSEILSQRLDKNRVSVNSGSGEARISQINLLNSQQREVRVLMSGDDAIIKVSVEVLKEIDSLVLGYAIKDKLGQVLFGTNTWHTGQVIERPKPGSIWHFYINFCADLGVGNYSISVALHDKEDHLNKNYDWKDLACIFQVVNGDNSSFVGLLNLKQNIDIEHKP